MNKLFDQTFWKMLLGFIVMLVLGLAAVFITGYLGSNIGTARVNQPVDTASIEEAVAPIE